MGRHCEHERQQRQRRRYAAALGKDSPAHLSRRVAPCGGGGGGNGDACGAQRYMARVATGGTHTAVNTSSGAQLYLQVARSLTRTQHERKLATASDI